MSSRRGCSTSARLRDRRRAACARWHYRSSRSGVWPWVPSRFAIGWPKARHRMTRVAKPEGEPLMRSLLLVSTLVLVMGCGGREAPVAWDKIANSEAVKLLRDDQSPYRVIYHAPVDLAKKPGS